MARPPAVVVHRAFVDDLGAAEQARLLRSAVAQLPGPTREVFAAQMGLHHTGGGGGDDAGARAVDIMLTNSFEMGLPAVAVSRDGGGWDGRRYFGNFPEVSRFNHDCRPKCVSPLPPLALFFPLSPPSPSPPLTSPTYHWLHNH